MGRYERVAELADLAPVAHAAGPGTTTGPGPGAPGGPTMEVADLGAGYGRTVRRLLDRATAQGTAVRVHAVDRASTLDDDVLHDERVRSVLADLDEPLPFADGELHRVVSVNTLEHLADPAAHLADCARALAPDGVLVLVHTDWDTALFAGPDGMLTRRLVDRFTATVPTFAEHADGFMGRKLLGLAHEVPGTRVEQVTTWADCHRRFDPDSVGWKVARGVLAATRDDADLAAPAEEWAAGLAALAAADRFLFSVLDVAVVLRRDAAPTR